MPSVTYMNQSAPFWDFVASLEQQGREHPMFAGNTNTNADASAERDEAGPSGPPPPPPPPFGPWGWGHGWGGRGFEHRGPRHGGPRGPHHHEEEKSGGDEEMSGEKEKEKDNEGEKGEAAKEGASDGEGCRRGTGRRGHCGRRGGRRGWGSWEGVASGDEKEKEGNGEGPSDGEGRCGHGPHRRWGGRRGCHGPGPYGHHGRGGFGPGAHHHGPHGGRGAGGPWGGRGGFFGGGPFNPLNMAAGLFDPANFGAAYDQFTNEATKSKQNGETEDFRPDADIFSTPQSYIIHLSLPGAKKEDVGVNYDAEKSELSIAGVIYRPGDEQLLQHLEGEGERKVGPFERKIRLGTRANPAQVDEEGITAKLEDGILKVEVPKEKERGFVEVYKVDVE